MVRMESACVTCIEALKYSRKEELWKTQLRPDPNLENELRPNA